MRLREIVQLASGDPLQSACRFCVLGAWPLASDDFRWLVHSSPFSLYAAVGHEPRRALGVDDARVAGELVDR